MTTEDRLAFIERQNRWLRLAIPCLALAVVALFFVAAAPNETPKEIKAQSFELVNAKGQTRALLSIDEEDSPSLLLQSGKNAPGVMIMAKPQSGVVSIHDANGRPRISIQEKEGRSSLSMDNDRGKPMLLATADADMSMVTVSSADGQPIAYMLRNTKGGSIQIDDATGKNVWAAPARR